MNISDRINLLIETQQLTIKDFAERCDIPYRSMYNYVRSEREPNLDALSKISQTFNVDLNWLILGEGKKEKVFSVNQELSQDEKALIDNYRKISKEIQQTIYTLCLAISQKK